MNKEYFKYLEELIRIAPHGTHFTWYNEFTEGGIKKAEKMHYVVNADPLKELITLAKWARDKAIPALKRYESQCIYGEDCHQPECEFPAKEALEALPKKEKE